MSLPQTLADVKPLMDINAFQGDFMRKRISLANDIYKKISKFNCIVDFNLQLKLKVGTKSLIYISTEPPMFIKETSDVYDQEQQFYTIVNQIITTKQSPNFLIMYHKSMCYQCRMSQMASHLFCPTVTLEMAKPLVSSHLSKNIQNQYSFICQLLLAINALHAHYVLHRDIRRFNMVTFSTESLNGKYFRFIKNYTKYDLPCLNHTPALVDFDVALNLTNKNHFYVNRARARDICDLFNFITSPGTSTYDSGVTHDNMHFHPTVVKNIKTLREKYPHLLGNAFKIFKLIYKYAKFDVVSDDKIEEVFFPKQCDF